MNLLRIEEAFFSAAVGIIIYVNNTNQQREQKTWAFKNKAYSEQQEIPEAETSQHLSDVLDGTLLISSINMTVPQVVHKIF